ncbi:MAG: NAD(P)-dependent oxidoreductase [Sciscionella sp.]
MRDAKPELILCSAGMPDDALARLARYGTVAVLETADLPRDRLRDAVAIAARASTRIDAPVLRAAPALRVLGRSGVGTDNIDVAEATRRGIPIVITPEATTRPVAEGAVALVLALAKRLPALHDAVKSGDWAMRDSLDLLDLDGTTLGVVGLGRVGCKVAELAAGLGFRVAAYEPFPAGDTQLVPLVDLHTLLSGSRVVVVTAAATETSRGMFGLDTLRRCRRGAVFVNVSRGELVASLDDLREALDRGYLSGVGLDVFDREPPCPSHPLFTDPRVIVTPHALAFTERGRRAVFTDMVDGMAAVLSGRRAEHIANPSVYEREANS